MLFNAAASPQTTHATACSWAVPFKVGVHFDADDAIGAPPTAANRDDVENDPASTTGAVFKNLDMVPTKLGKRFTVFLT